MGVVGWPASLEVADRWQDRGGWPISLGVGDTIATVEFASPKAKAKGHPAKAMGHPPIS